MFNIAFYDKSNTSVSFTVKVHYDTMYIQEYGSGFH